MKKTRRKFDVQANPRICKLRAYLLSDERREELPEELREDRIIAGLYESFEQEYFYSRQGTLEQDSIQKAIIETLSKSDPTTGQLYEIAKRDARGALFDYLARQEFMDSKRTDDLETKKRLAELLADPYLLTSDLQLQEFIADGIASDGPEFLKDLYTMFYNAERREQALKGDKYKLVIATHWTDSHCPFWLMQVDAILKACNVLSVNGSWTKEMVNERLKKLKLKRFTPAPIVDVQINTSGNIESFHVSSKVFSNLNDKAFHHEMENLPNAPETETTNLEKEDDSPEIIKARRCVDDLWDKRTKALSRCDESTATNQSRRANEFAEIDNALKKANAELRKMQPREGRENIQWKPRYRALEEVQKRSSY